MAKVNVYGDSPVVMEEIEISLVIPCLNEADTLDVCLRRAHEGLAAFGSATEIILADNESTDDSRAIAERHGVRVVTAPERGYGNALMCGITAARGRYIVMGDADLSHDLTVLPAFIEKLRTGFDLAQGCRMPSGGGTLFPGSMSFARRTIGNPFLSFIARQWFGVPVHDVNCGFRAFTRELYDRLKMRCTGMEFSVEMIVKAGFQGARVAEVPITHYPDGRISQPAHNRAFRDGWRTLRFFLMYSPRWLFLFPGGALALTGVLVYILSLVGSLQWTSSTKLMASVFAGLAILCGYQSILFAVFTKVFATREGLLAKNERFERLFNIINLERALALSAMAIVSGSALLLGSLMPPGPWGSDTISLALFGATIVAIGFQTVLSGFFLSILGLKSK